jgi:hypothetical protein
MISLIITIAIVGLIVWAICTLVPMPAPFKKAIVVFAIICVVIYLLSALGLWHPHDMPVPNLNH